ncbi:Structural maintenance of chromosomes protein 4 [Bienertia sinuspersici]
MSKDRFQEKYNCGLRVGMRTSCIGNNLVMRLMACKFYELESELVLEKKVLEAELNAMHTEVVELQGQRGCSLRMTNRRSNAKL